MPTMPIAGVNTNLLVGWEPLAALVAAVALLLLFLAYPLGIRLPDDQGDGNSLVLIPSPVNPRQWKAPTLVALFVVLYILYHSAHGPLSPDQLYASALRRLSSAVVRAPAQLDGYLNGFTLGLRFLAMGAMVSLTIVGRGSLARRGLMLLNAVWYTLTMLFIDALLLVIEVLFSFPVGPATLLGNFAALALAYLGMVRMMFISYALPRPSTIPFVRRPRLNDAVVLIAITVCSMAICAALLVLAYHALSPQWKPALALIAPVPFAEVSSAIRSMLLGVMGWLTTPKAPPVDEQPPIDIIIPAYNEEEVIVETLEAIDKAAGRYGGPVMVTLMNDGSTDRTRELAERTVAAFRHARARVVDGNHGGKSAALNGALAYTTADLVVRIDADTLIDEWSLVYVPRWFRYPDVGIVEGMYYPRWRRSWFPHMRLFEELEQFGYFHRTIQSVDGVNVVPGVFTAFRREVAVGLNGFTVGMNGEDGDFTLRCSRVGYRSVMDTKVIVREDVPPTYLEIREQRIRWSRGNIHNNSRHGPYRAGIGTPKVWYSQTHQFLGRVFAPVRLMLPFFLLLTALFDGTYRTAVLALFGAWLFVSMAFVVLEAALSVGYRQTRHLGWVVLWPLFQAMKEIWSTEAWLSLPARPAGIHGSRPSVVQEAVVH